MQEFIDFETELLEARWIVVQTNDIVHIGLPIKWSWMGATCKELINLIHLDVGKKFTVEIANREGFSGRTSLTEGHLNLYTAIRYSSSQPWSRVADW